MAEIKVSYKDIVHMIYSYDDIIATYDWLKDALQAIFLTEKDFRFLVKSHLI